MSHHRCRSSPPLRAHPPLPTYTESRRFCWLYGYSLDTLALCLRHVGGRRSAARVYPPCSKAFPGDTGCVFCNLIASIDYAIENGMSRDEAEAAGGLILRGKHCFICLNAFPYTSGHVMVMPYAHLDRIAKLTTDAAHELMDLAQQTERVAREALSPPWLQLRPQPGPGGRRGRGRPSAPARHAALGGRHQFHDHRGRNPRPARRPGDHLETHAGSIPRTGTKGVRAY